MLSPSARHALVRSSGFSVGYGLTLRPCRDRDSEDNPYACGGTRTFGSTTCASALSPGEANFVELRRGGDNSYGCASLNRLDLTGNRVLTQRRRANLDAIRNRQESTTNGPNLSENYPRNFGVSKHTRRSLRMLYIV